MQSRKKQYSCSTNIANGHISRFAFRRPNICLRYKYLLSTIIIVDGDLGLLVVWFLVVVCGLVDLAIKMFFINSQAHFPWFCTTGVTR